MYIRLNILKYIMSVYIVAMVHVCHSQLECKSQRAGIFVLLMAASLEPRMVTGTQQMLNKYFLNE